MELRILGPVEAWDEGQRLALGGPQQRTLLAVLLLNANRVVSTDQLVAELWAEDPPPDARMLLRGCVARLRRTLRGERPATAAERLVTRPPGYLVEVRPDELDLDRFEELVRSARQSLGERSRSALHQAAGQLHEALALWRGPALNDLTAGACRPYAANLEERRLEVLEQRIDVDLALGRHPQLAGELEQHVREYPLRERLWAQLMVALYAADRQSDALAAYRQLRQILMEQLAVEPTATLRSLERALLTGADVGEVYRRAYDGPSVVEPEPAPHSVSPGLLPADVAGFTGRAEHIKQLDALLEGGTTTAVISAIAGTAGVGKTALAVHWAHQVRERFPDGQLYVNLRGYAPGPADAPDRGARRLSAGPRSAGETGTRRGGVRGGPVPQHPRRQAGAGRAGQRQPRRAGPAAAAGQPGLSGPGDQPRPAARTGRPGRRPAARPRRPPAGRGILPARAVARAATGYTAEPEAAAELAELCAFLPLALRIAAAALIDAPQRTLASYVAELTVGNRLAALAVEDDEYSGVRATFDLSHAALEPAARRLFRLLGLVPGPEVTAGAAAALAGVPVARAASLLDRITGAHLLNEHAPGRYAFHDLLRAYANEQAGADPDAPAALDRLYDWYLHGVDSAARLLYPQKLRLSVPLPTDPPEVGFDDHVGALAWLDAERPNLVVAIQHAAEHGPRNAAWLLADSLRHYFWLRRYVVDWLAAAQSGSAAAETDGDVRAQAATQFNLGDAYRCQSRYSRAIAHYGRARALMRQAGWPGGEAGTLLNLGNVYRDAGQLARAVEHYRQALAINQEHGRLLAAAISHAHLGLVCHELGQLRQAADHLTTGLELQRQVGHRLETLVDVGKLAETFHALGRFDDAVDHLAVALIVHRQLGHRAAEVENLRILADVQRDSGHVQEAHETAVAALSLARQTGDRRFEADVLNTLAEVCRRLAQGDQAMEYHRSALQLAREIEARYTEVVALVGLAGAYRDSGRLDEARVHAGQALALACQAGYRVLEGQARVALADVHRALGRSRRAVRYARQAVLIAHDTGHRLGLARALLVLGDAVRQRGDADLAARHRRTALAVLADIGAPGR